MSGPKTLKIQPAVALWSHFGSKTAVFRTTETCFWPQRSLRALHVPRGHPHAPALRLTRKDLTAATTPLSMICTFAVHSLLRRIGSLAVIGAIYAVCGPLPGGWEGRATAEDPLCMPREVCPTPPRPRSIFTQELYRGTSLIRTPPLLGPYSRTMPRVLWWS